MAQLRDRVKCTYGDRLTASGGERPQVRGCAFPCPAHSRTCRKRSSRDAKNLEWLLGSSSGSPIQKCGAPAMSLDLARRSAYSSAAMAGHVLMIEDDERLAAMVSDYLGEVGFRVNHHANAEDGLAALKRVRFDALILDVMLPDVGGFEVCRRVRATSDIPILMLTARGEATDRVVGLELGADDYLSKPFNPHELLARLKAILRRSKAAHSRESVLRFGRLEIDREAYIARIDGRERPLTSYQFALLLAMAKHAGRVMSRDALMDLMKGEPLEAFDRAIDVHISRIRAAIEDDPKRPRRIITVRGVGYVFARSQDGDGAE